MRIYSYYLSKIWVRNLELWGPFSRVFSETGRPFRLPQFFPWVLEVLDWYSWVDRLGQFSGLRLDFGSSPTAILNDVQRSPNSYF